MIAKRSPGVGRGSGAIAGSEDAVERHPNHKADITIQTRLEEMKRRLDDVWARASDTAAPGLTRARPALETMGTAVEDLHLAAQEVAATARRVQTERLRYEHLFQLAPNGYLVTDQAAVIEEANQAAGVLLARDPGSVVGETLHDLLAPEQRERVTEIEDAARADPRGVVVADDVMVTVAGGEMPVSVRCRAICDVEDRVVGYGWILDDLGGRFEAERRARESQEADIAHFRDLAQHWERLESAKSHFLSLASHELRTPVTVLGGYLSMLDAGTFGQLPQPVESVIALLVAKTRELNDLVNDMLETARLDDDRVGLRTQVVDIAEVVGHVVDDWRPLKRPEQRLRLVRPDEAVTVSGDPARLRTIVTNLVGNAIKYSPDGGDIVCSVGRNGGEVVVSVADSGVGVAPESLSLLFTRFGRVVTPATSRVPGTGLGLYIARELARMHGGDITVQSTVGEGSVFTVSLPLLAAADEAGAAERAVPS